jgi:hypothetical protein
MKCYHDRSRGVAAHRIATSSSVKRDVESSGSCELKEMSFSAYGRTLRRERFTHLPVELRKSYHRDGHRD